MNAELFHIDYECMGTQWNVTVWDAVPSCAQQELKDAIIGASRTFGATYSRFKKTSLIWSLTEKRGVVAVPCDLVVMLRLYERLYYLSGGKVNPLIGFMLSDLGYDIDHSFKCKETIRSTPELHDALTIVDDEHIRLDQPVLIDLGALGKGYFVDVLSRMLAERGYRRFLVDGSGDIYYRSNGHPIRAGLEHPADPTKAIGVVTMQGNAMCSSAGNRRKWAGLHHTIDPHSQTSPQDIIAVWVMAESAALADGLTTCLFFCEPDRFKQAYHFEYCLLNRDYKVWRSDGFIAELF